MVLIKLWYHICALISHFLYKIIYRGKVKFGKKVTWRRNFSLMIGKKGKVIIGDDCFFNSDCTVDSDMLVTIGGGCLFGENVKIYDHNHRFAGTEPIRQQGFSSAEVHIGSHCWICSNVVILKGSNIGDNCVIGAGCIVSGTVPVGTVLKNKADYITEIIKDI